jgi:hypothetical protein
MYLRALLSDVGLVALGEGNDEVMAVGGLKGGHK